MSSTHTDASNPHQDIHSLSFHIIQLPRMSAHWQEQTGHWKRLAHGHSSIGWIIVEDRNLRMMPFNHMGLNSFSLVHSTLVFLQWKVSGKNEHIAGAHCMLHRRIQYLARPGCWNQRDEPRETQEQRPGWTLHCPTAYKIDECIH